MSETTNPDFVSVPRLSELTSLSIRQVWRLVRRGDVPSLKVGRRRLVPLKEAIQALRMINRPREEGSSNRGEVKIPIIPDEEWGLFHGKNVKHGALKAHTDTDYLVFSCPECGTHLCGGAGILLLGGSSSFGSGKSEDVPVLIFQIHCIACGLIDHFKIAIDQYGRYDIDRGQ